jgi:transcriptional regulator with XRE-family HTH domain
MTMTADKLKTWMAAQKLTKTDFAALTGIARTTLDRYLAGQQPIPKVVVLSCIAIENGLCPWGY